MENVLYDYHIAKALGEGTPHADNYKRVLYVESVFKKYGITQAQFDSSMVWFSRNPEVLGKIYENIVNRLKAEQTNLEELLALREGKPRTSVAGDSVDVWFGQQLYRLTGTPLTNRLTFSLPADSNFQDRDTLRWHVRFLFSGTAFDSVAAPVMSLSLHYKNDSVVSDLRKVCEAGEYSITLCSEGGQWLCLLSRPGWTYPLARQYFPDALPLHRHAGFRRCRYTEHRAGQSCRKVGERARTGRQGRKAGTGKRGG